MTLGKHIEKIRLSKILPAVVVCLLFTNVIFLVLFLNEHDRNKRVVSTAPMASQETKVGPQDVKPAPQEVKVAVAPPARSVEKAPDASAGKSAPPPAQSSVSAVAGIPAPFVSAEPGEYALLCEKQTKQLRLYRVNTGNVFNLVKTYPCIIGSNNGDKLRPGDFATPEGVYFFLRFIPGKSLPAQYGSGAFVLNYPNYLSRREGKKGNGIWLHGHYADKSIGKDILNTKGCIAVENGSLKEIESLVKPNSTPIVITGQVKTINKEKQDVLAGELRQFLEAWRKSWESLNTKKYLSLYAPDFVSGQGMDYTAFKNHKEKVNKNKKFIKVAVERPFMLMPPEYGGDVGVIRFTQKYVSDNFKSEGGKIFYVKKVKSKWQIFGESMF